MNVLQHLDCVTTQYASTLYLQLGRVRMMRGAKFVTEGVFIVTQFVPHILWHKNATLSDESNSSHLSVGKHTCTILVHWLQGEHLTKLSVIIMSARWCY